MIYVTIFLYYNTFSYTQKNKEKNMNHDINGTGKRVWVFKCLNIVK